MYQSRQNFFLMLAHMNNSYFNLVNVGLQLFPFVLSFRARCQFISCFSNPDTTFVVGILECLVTCHN